MAIGNGNETDSGREQRCSGSRLDLRWRQTGDPPGQTIGKNLLRNANWGEKWQNRASTIYVLLGIIKKGRKFKNEDRLK
jgi:hypothetical protein